MKFAGVDGCPFGWVVAALDGSVFLCPTFAEVVRATLDADLVLVDIPMGLDDRRHLRACEQSARTWLGARRSTIFPVPVRAAVHAPDYSTASALNFAATGKKLSMQSWHICRKIAQADLVLRADPSLQGRLRESHPELCFAALNGWQPLITSKKTREGQAERLALLQRHTPGVTLPTGIRRLDAAPDDVLDAMVLALSARLAFERGLPQTPNPAEVDALGLLMAIVTPYPPGEMSD